MTEGREVEEARGRFNLRNPSALRWTVGLGATAMVLIGMALLFLLTQATNNRELYEQNYGRLFALNVVVASALFAVIAWIATRLALRFKQKKFGSRLLVKLAGIFALVGFVPGLLIYVVSYQFVSRSIESWFDVKVEGALDAGLNLGRVTLETRQNDLATKSKSSALQLADVSEPMAGLLLERVRDQLDATDVSLWSLSGQLLGSSGQSRFQLSPERPSSAQFRNARANRAITWLEGFDDATPGTLDSSRIKALVLISNASVGKLGEARFLYVTQSLPPSLVANALAVNGAYLEYKERTLGRVGLQRMYIGTLTLSLFLAVFGAVLLAVLLGNQIARPLLVLADGVSQVAAGDLTPKAALQGKDELGGLTRAFAGMTMQLADARAAVESSMNQVNAARANLQTILDNLTAGVIVLDTQGVIQSSNPGATRILRAPLAASEGRHLEEVHGLESFAQGIQHEFERFVSTRNEHGLDHWQQSFELGGAHLDVRMGRYEHALTLVVRGAKLPGDHRLLVFDDITEIVSAQRAQAWGEVARRLAHEIKNPLTPIQLSAERLEMKLTGKLAPSEQAILSKSVKTIVDQVDAMKRLVNEFRDYARLPAAELKPVDLNLLVSEVLQLYSTDHPQIPIQLDLDPACQPIYGDEHQLRQVVHNLLQNAQDASEGLTPVAAVNGETTAIVLKTQSRDGAGRVRLCVIDHGTGFPDHILKRAFEPYVTTKAKGTGLGLAVVKKIADEHGTRVDIINRIADGKVFGAQVSLSFAVVQAALT